MLNYAFAAVFNLHEAPSEGNWISDIHNPFWKSAETKQRITDVLVKGIALKDKIIKLTDKAINFSIKIIDSNESQGKNILLIIKTVK